MALLRKEEYGDGFRIEIGEKLEDVQEEQLKITNAEMLKAINQENLTDRLFARVLKNRSKSHETLMNAIPGTRGEGS